MQRVLLIGCDDLITSGIASLLQHAHDVNLLNQKARDIQHLIDEINDFTPNILVLKNNLKFVTSSSMMELLSKFPDLRIITVDESRNIIHVYEKQEIQVNQSADLLGLIRKTNDLVRESMAY